MTKRIPHDEVSTEIPASPEVFHDSISDITRMGERSPECVRATWSKGATGPGIGSYTWRYVLEPLPAGTRVADSFDAEKPLGAAMTWITEKWTGSSDRDGDLRRGMETTLARPRVAAETT